MPQDSRMFNSVGYKGYVIQIVTDGNKETFYVITPSPIVVVYTVRSLHAAKCFIAQDIKNKKTANEVKESYS